MMDRNRFEGSLQEVLTRLYDPTYSISDDLWTILGGSTPRTHLSLQEQIAEHIRRMEPQDDQPGAYRTRRHYLVLHYRYVLELTQKETAHLMQVSPRHLRREQQQAVQVLAQRIWEGWERICNDRQTSATAAGSAQNINASEEPLSEENARQIQREIALLQDQAPNATTEVGTEIERVARVMDAILAERNVELVHDYADDLRAQVHPSVFRQILIGAINGLASQMDGGCILVRARNRKDGVSIAVCGNPFVRRAGDSAWRLFANQAGCTTAYARNGRQSVFLLKFPPIDKFSILVVDDNADVVHVFRRYTMGTRFHIEEIDTRQNVRAERRSQNLHAQVVELQPDAIVLDVLMPDMDGWEVLAELHRDKRTRTIPVVVCSIVGANGLASALGAAAHLSKPVTQDDFLSTLKRVCRLLPADSPQGGKQFPR